MILQVLCASCLRVCARTCVPEPPSSFWRVLGGLVPAAVEEAHEGYGCKVRIRLQGPDQVGHSIARLSSQTPTKCLCTQAGQPHHPRTPANSSTHVHTQQAIQRTPAHPPTRVLRTHTYRQQRTPPHPPTHVCRTHVRVRTCKMTLPGAKRGASSWIAGGSGTEEKHASEAYLWACKDSAHAAAYGWGEARVCGMPVHTQGRRAR